MQTVVKQLLEEMRSVLCGHIRPSSAFTRTRLEQIAAVINIEQELGASAPGSIASALRSANWSGVPIGNKALIEAAAQALNNGGQQLPETINVMEMAIPGPRQDAMARLLALEPNADNLKRWQALEAQPLRKLWVEGSPSDGYGAWMTDTDGNLHALVTFDHPYAAADWCERNGFAWEVIGADDPVARLAAWRAGK